MAEQGASPSPSKSVNMRLSGEEQRLLTTLRDRLQKRARAHIRVTQKAVIMEGLALLERQLNELERKR
jgi:hypothetical protein